MSDPVIPSIIRGSGPSVVIRTASGDGAYQAGTAAETRALLELIPEFTTQPASKALYETLTANLTVVATSIIGTLSYQWYLQQGGVGAISSISGATSASYTTPALVAATDNGNKYYCDVSNGLDTVRSSAATLTVNSAPTLRYGVTTPVALASSLATNTVWVPYRPIGQAGTLQTVSLYFNVTGAYKLKVLRPGDVTCDEVYSGAFTATTGLNTLTTADFGVVTVAKGDLVGIYTQVARPAYDASGPGADYYYKLGDTTASGNTLLYEPTIFHFQMAFTVLGLPSYSNGVFDEAFDGGALPFGWKHNNPANPWTYSGAKATTGTTGHANSLNHNHVYGNLSNWTWYTEFTFDTAGARFFMATRNTVQTINGTFFEVDEGTNNLVVYHTSGKNGWDNSGGLVAFSTTSTGMTLATATPYRLSLQKAFRTLTITLTDINTPANTYTATFDVEDGTGTPGSGTLMAGFADGAPAVGAVLGTISVTRSKFDVLNATPDWLFLGDSITEGSGITSSALGYARTIAADTGLTIVTSCQGGATSSHCVDRLVDELNVMRPTKVHFLVGTNDTTSTGQSTATWKANMSYLIDILTGLGIEVWVGCIPPEAADNNPETDMNPFIIAQGWNKVRYDLALTNPATGLAVNRDATKFYDTLHPNALGNSAMRDRFLLDVGL